MSKNKINYKKTKRSDLQGKEFCSKNETMFQELELLEYLQLKFKNIDLSNVVLVSLQHILQSNYITLEYFFRLGLKPENTFLLGKAYSSNKEVAEHLSSLGVNVHQDSFSFDSHESYDLQLERYVKNFIFDITPLIRETAHIEKIVVVDDGGYLISQITDATFHRKVVALEWTSSGYRKLLGNDLKIPVLNMARSDTKLKIESPIIGLGVVEKIKEQYPNIFSSNKIAVVMGAGHIGQAVKKSLNDLQKKVVMVDVDTLIDEIKDSFDLIIGCTGEKLFGESDLEKMKDVVLVSASSSDREFSAVEIRKKFPQNNNPHKEYVSGNLKISNSGFPINFDGMQVNIMPLEKIQITLGMVFASVCLCASRPLENGLNNFPGELDKEITNFFLELPN